VGVKREVVEDAEEEEDWERITGAERDGPEHEAKPVLRVGRGVLRGIFRESSRMLSTTFKASGALCGLVTCQRSDRGDEADDKEQGNEEDGEWVLLRKEE